MMVHGQSGAHLSEFLLRNKLRGYTQGKERGLTPPCSRRASCGRLMPGVNLPGSNVMLNKFATSLSRLRGVTQHAVHTGPYDMSTPIPNLFSAATIASRLAGGDNYENGLLPFPVGE